jgi:hypothetical protein
VYRGEELEEDFDRYPHIVFDEQGEFVFCSAKFKGLTDTIDEIEFFGETALEDIEEQFRQGEVIQVSADGESWAERTFIVSYNNLYFCMNGERQLVGWNHARPQPALTIKEAEEKFGIKIIL